MLLKKYTVDLTPCSPHALPGATVWYDSSQPCHPRLHQSHIRPLLEGGTAVHSLRPLTHSLRAVKSPAEVALMKQAGRITAQVGCVTAHCL